jgi:hypothetical protein
MLKFQVHFRIAWDDYFTGSKTNYNSETYGSRPTLSGTSVYVSNCLFRSFTSGSDGGALCCTSVTYLLIELTSFFSCKTSGQSGGAIYFSCSSGQCVLHEICCYDCCSTFTGWTYGQFARIYVKDAVTSKNYVNYYSSIVRCVGEGSMSHYTLRLSNGKICCPSVNISINECRFYSGIFCYRDTNSFTCSFSYSSFTDNIANGYTCICICRGCANCEFKSCNILRNTQGSLDSNGIFYTGDTVNIEDSCILENKANRIFHQGSSYTITLTNCTVDSFSSNRNIVIRNTVTKSFILALKHMSTQNCHSGFDSVGYLTPIIQTPSPSKKYQSRLRIFFSMFLAF